LERVLVLGGFVSMVLADIILGRGDPSLVGILLILLVPGFICTGLLLWRPRHVFYLLAGLANSALAIGAIPFGLFAFLANPLLGPIYVAGVLIVLSALLALPAGVFGYLHGQAGRTEKPLAEGIRTPHGLAALAVVALSLGAIVAGSLAYQSANLPPSNANAGYDIPRWTNFSIQVSGSRFLPRTFNVTAFAVTRITVLNEDGGPHTFTYVNNGTTYSHDLPAEIHTRFFVLFYLLGPVRFWSTVPSDVGMNGTMQVIGTGSPPESMSVSLSKSSDLTNWILLVTSVPIGKAYTSTSLAIFRGDGSSNLTATALGSLNTAVHGCTLVKVNSTATMVRVGDRILCKTGWYATGSTYQISDGATLLATGKFQ
jgi:hypothetical protein